MSWKFARAATLLAAAALAAFAAQAASPSTAPPFDGPTIANPRLTPDFALRDQHGRLIRLSRLRGKVVLLTFLYTHCPDVCPLTASRLNAALRLLGPAAGRVRVVAVSVDPRGDTHRSVSAFIRAHRLLPEFHYLTGSRSTLMPIWREYGVRTALTVRGKTVVSHTLYTLLLDRSGRARVLYDSTAPPTSITHDVRLLLHLPS